MTRPRAFQRTAVLSLDFLPEIVANYATDGEAAVANASRVLTAARDLGLPVIHVVPEWFKEIHGAVAPVDDEPVLRKASIGAFASTKLDLLLRRAGLDQLIVVGIATSGTVTSTVRWAYDVGYQQYVVEDACSDPEADVHQALTGRTDSTSWIGLWRLATIIGTDQLIEDIRAGKD